MLKRVIFFLGIIILLSLLSIFYPYITGEKQINQEYEKETCFVNRIIDGDTLVCDNETIRLLGIDNKEVVSIPGY
jgi:endonuclease YncB( thermonuclease family)